MQKFVDDVKHATRGCMCCLETKALVLRVATEVNTTTGRFFVI